MRMKRFASGRGIRQSVFFLSRSFGPTLGTSHTSVAILYGCPRVVSPLSGIWLYVICPPGLVSQVRISCRFVRRYSAAYLGVLVQMIR
jgi:hypothetical protein